MDTRHARRGDPAQAFGEGWVHLRGAVLQRVFAHDVYHCGELNEAFGTAGLPQIEVWD